MTWKTDPLQKKKKKVEDGVQNCMHPQNYRPCREENVKNHRIIDGPSVLKYEVQQKKFNSKCINVFVIPQKIAGVFILWR